MEITEKITTNEDGMAEIKVPEKRKRSNPFNVNQKEEKEKRRQKRARIIIRNISYKATEETLRNHFAKFGSIQDLNLLKRPDGKLVGCAFVQYEAINQAAKAILKTSNKDFLGRTIFVDWALGKDEYERKKNVSNETKPKVEPVSDTKAETEDKSGDSGDGEEVNATIKSESESEGGAEESDESDDESENGSEESSPNEGEDKKDIKPNFNSSKEKHISDDVKEGCTIFIKNVPFDAEDTDLRKVCRKFGPLYYAIINRDPVSGYSKGTAFVKFKSKESADLCLASGTEFQLNDTSLDPYPALSREEVRQQKNKDADKEKGKDSRNLYLAREGLIMTGSKAAEGLSASDMSKRHKLEQIKNQVLKNLNRFVSRNRLSIHNLPLNYDNENLRNMVLTYTGFKPHECRVMRENKITPDYPKGKSKGFGFMSFTTHKEALMALRKLNNNPKIFGNVHRPIVAFSIEDRSVHKIKQKRTLKSKLNNPTYKDKVEKRKRLKDNNVKVTKTQQRDDKEALQKHIKELETSRSEKASKNSDSKADIVEDFVGFAGKPGVSVKMRSKKKIMEQSLEHRKKVREQKRKDKQRKLKMLHRIEKKQIERPKQGKKKIGRDDLSHLVNKYKKLIDSRANESSSATIPEKKKKRTKWYTE